MFDSDKNFLTTFPQYKLLLTMKRTFTEKKKSDWDKGECFSFAVGEQSESHT